MQKLKKIKKWNKIFKKIKKERNFCWEIKVLIKRRIIGKGDILNSLNL